MVALLVQIKLLMLLNKLMNVIMILEIEKWIKTMQTYHPTGFTLGEFELKILTKELMATGKTRSEIVRGLIADLGRKQAKQNKAA